ncbi:hypothetical protein P6144_08595 [Sphingomonas sp. HITSZ_GF]|uniref:hypothetical protein n=1 Tax=Sphingomonas sp. HITSZ_GF TaxID=3037247 RepID=UPI00240DB874|nr:hypothetical protein [Sphingomonas sp. HITSZ_GF]MDG2533702.1 hypothetical protein [Sphingomonas sp. HITSZ_GF]
MAWLALALALAGAPQSVESLGRYAVRDTAGKTLCTVRLSQVPDVGGEIETLSGCVGVLAPLRDASRWQDDDRGGFVLRDPIRKTVATVSEDEAGLTLHIGGRSWDFVKLDQPPPLTPGQRAQASWSLIKGGRTLCHVKLAARGTTIGPGCPAPFAKGSWSASEKGVTLRAGKLVRAFNWSDPATLESGAWTLLRD